MCNTINIFTILSKLNYICTVLFFVHTYILQNRKDQQDEKKRKEREYKQGNNEVVVYVSSNIT